MWWARLFASQYGWSRVVSPVHAMSLTKSYKCMLQNENSMISIVARTLWAFFENLSRYLYSIFQIVLLTLKSKGKSFLCAPITTAREPRRTTDAAFKMQCDEHCFSQNITEKFRDSYTVTRPSSLMWRYLLLPVWLSVLALGLVPYNECTLSGP